MLLSGGGAIDLREAQGRRAGLDYSSLARAGGSRGWPDYGGNRLRHVGQSATGLQHLAMAVDDVQGMAFPLVIGGQVPNYTTNAILTCRGDQAIQSARERVGKAIKSGGGVLGIRNCTSFHESRRWGKE